MIVLMNVEGEEIVCVLTLCEYIHYFFYFLNPSNKMRFLNTLYIVHVLYNAGQKVRCQVRRQLEPTLFGQHFICVELVLQYHFLLLSPRLN